MISKVTRKLKKNPFNGLTREQGFEFEKECLFLLQKNFECTCGLECNHFPIINNSINKLYKMFITDCGISLDKYKKLIEKDNLEPYEIKKQNEQINCIISNLKKCKIKHLDMHPSGKNMCINKNGIVSLIDFDIAIIDNNPLSKQISKRIMYYKNEDDYYTQLEQKINEIIKDNI